MKCFYCYNKNKFEIADVKINYDTRFDMDGFAKLADFFFDGLIADWYMQSKINNSYNSVSNVKNQVTSTIYKLQQVVFGLDTALGRKKRTKNEKRKFKLYYSSPYSA